MLDKSATCIHRDRRSGDLYEASVILIKPPRYCIRADLVLEEFLVEIYSIAHIE